MIRGVRGATTIERNNESEIINETEKLLLEMIKKNEITPETVASIFISTTEDINAEFPAKALRKFEGWSYVPIMCMREITVVNSLKLCIRVMIHINTQKEQKDIQHVYLNGATTLRPDLIKK